MKKLITIFGVVALMPLMLNAFTKKDVLILIGMTDYEYQNHHICDTGLWTDDDGNPLDSCGVGLTPFMGNYLDACDSLDAEYEAGNKNIVNVTDGMKLLFPELFDREESEFDLDLRIHFADFNIFYLSERKIYVRDISQDHEALIEGGMQRLNDFITSCINYPPQSKAAGIQGTVLVSFVVEADGSIGDVEVVKGVETYIDWEARRIIRRLPRFTPGIRNGRPSRFKYNIPVTFKLQ